MPEKKNFSQKLMAQQWLWRPLGVILACLIGLGIVLYVLWPVLAKPGLAPGSDVTSFAHTAKVLIDYFLKYRRFPAIDLSWYAGFEHQSAPPLIYFYLGALYLLTHNLELATRILHVVGIAITFLIMFMVVKKEKYPTFNAWIAALAYTFLPQIFMSIHSYTKLIALFLLPISFYFVNKILADGQSRYKSSALLAIVTALVIYSHPMNGVVYILSLVIYAALYVFLDNNLNAKRFFWVIAGFGLGVVLASSFLIPFIFGSPEGTFSKANLWERSLIVNPMGTIDFKPTLGIMGGWIVLFLVPIYVVWRTRNPKFIAVFLSGMITLAIAFAYILLPLGAFFPFKLTYAYVWLYFTGFTSAYLYGMTVPINSPQNLIKYFGRLILTVSLIVLYFFLIYRLSNFGRLNNQASLPSDIKLSKYLSGFSNQGRILHSHYPLGELGWPLWLYADKPNVEGHYFGVSQIGKQIALINDATHNEYPEYILKKFKFLNIRYFIANWNLWEMENPQTGILVGQKLLKRIQETGYKLNYELDTSEGLAISPTGKKYRLYYLDQPSAYVQPIDEEILAIGKYAPTLAAAVSPLKVSMLEGSSKYFDDYDLDFLKRFKAVFLYGFAYRDKDQAEKLAKDYINGGGKLIIELFGMENSKLEENPSFLGVTGNRVKITESREIEADEKTRDLLPQTFELPGEIIDVAKTVEQGALVYVPMKEWNALEYLNLDSSWAQLSKEDDFYSILGYKNVEGQKVVFVGLNLFYHLYNTHNPQELALVDNLIKNFVNNGSKIFNQKLSNNGFQTTQEELGPEYWRFQVKTKNDRLVLISLAYSPNWQAYVDGNPTKVYQAENLMVVKMPAGEHTLEMKYEKTPIKILASVISILTLLFLVGLLIYNRYHRQKEKTNVQTIN